MKTKRASLLLSTMLVASCFAIPAYADDADQTKADESQKSEATATEKPNLQPPEEPKAEDLKNSTGRGIFVGTVKSKATTADNKNDKLPEVKPAANMGGSHSYGGTLIENSTKTLIQPKQIQPKKVQPKQAKIEPAAKTVVIQKSSTTPLHIKNHSKVTLPTVKTAKSPVVKPHTTVATKTTKQPTATLVEGDSIVTAWLNKTGNSPHYKDGEKLQVNVSANKDCNLMIFNYDGEQLTQLYPNKFQSSPFVKSGQTIAVGGEGFKFDFIAANGGDKASHEKIFVYAYPVDSDSAPISVAMKPVEDSPFRAANMSLEEYRSMVNSSSVFFGRKVKVAKKSEGEVGEVQLANFEDAQSAAPNKIELSLVVDGTK
ncbi:MAG: DUF4384 domain-containing protein [Candidatus Obscuribacterales bacterium]|nr:DUF4384 domain-containing protein [Candidatus Obscuribacterales bacterium]